MAIFLFSRWRPADILDFDKVKSGVTARCGLSMSTTTPNLVTVAQMEAELLRFSDFQHGGRPPSWVLIQPQNDVTARCGLSVRKRTPNVVNISRKAAEIWRFSFFPSWILTQVKSGATARLWTARVYHHAKFGDNSSNGGRVIAFCGKIQNDGVRHFEFVFGNSGPPTKLTMALKSHRKFGVNRTFTFQDIAILKF